MSTALTLYDIEEHLLALVDTEDVTPEEQRQAIVAEIAAANSAAVAKRDRMIQFFRHLDMLESAAKQQAEYFRAKEAKIKAARERLAGYCVHVIQQFVPAPEKGPRKLEGTVGTLAVRQNPQSVLITDEAAVPLKYKTAEVSMPAELWERMVESVPAELREEFVRTSSASSDIAVSKEKLSRCLKAGIEVPGAVLSDGQFRLEVK